MEKEKRYVIRNMLIFILIIIFFVCVVFIYYLSLYYATRDYIISNGRINAIESAEQIDKYLSSSIDILKLASYTLDNMIRDKRSQAEILDYLTNETIAVRDSLIDDTTGIYGYFNGEYMDGSGWDPGEDYVPTKRPWYVEAKGGNGRLVIVDPYLDLDTGTVMVSIVKTLCDTRSVVGIDISMDELQAITEDHVSKKLSFSEFIINARGQIIAHSDKNLVGKKYNDPTYPLGVSISKKFRSSDNGSFYMDFEGRDYMVYCMPLENEWTCITIIDATNDFRKLRFPLVITIISAIIMMGGLSFFMLLSDRKSREARELLVKSERATAANEAKSSFLSNMSHEIRTPINAIIGMNEMILRESNDSTVLSYSQNIKTASGTLLGLINDILDFSKIEAGKIEIIPVDYDLSSLVNDLVNMCHTRADEKGLILNLDLDRNIPSMLNGDEVHIKQIISNIMTNAIKYTNKGSVTFSMGYEKIDDDPDSIILHVKIKDTGIGIKSEDMEKLFSKFDRLDEKRNRNIEGTGLGMNITNSLLSFMGSSLEVESVYGAGSVFGFSLKQKVINWEPLGDYEATFYEHVKKREQYKASFIAPEAAVLAVDDNIMNLLVFKSLIKKTKLNIDTAESGGDCLAMAGNKKYDIIFLDHMMPGMDGIETLHLIKEQRTSPNLNTPVICLTANALSGAREQYISEGFDDYLPKPIDADRLEKMLIRLLPGEKVILMEEHDPNENSDITEIIPEELNIMKDTSEINIYEGIRSSGTVESYLSLLKIFLNSIDVKSKELEKLYQEKDIKNYTIKVHAIKSSARIIGAADFGKEAQLLENAGKANDFNYIDSHHNAFLYELKHFKEPISIVFANEVSVEEKPEADISLITESYSELFYGAVEMDCDRIEAVFDKLDSYSIPKEEKELFFKLKSASDIFDYEEICSLLSLNKGFSMEDRK